MLFVQDSNFRKKWKAMEFEGAGAQFQTNTIRLMHVPHEHNEYIFKIRPNPHTLRIGYSSEELVYRTDKKCYLKQTLFYK